jgi:Tfp pilus assembly protein PilX
MEQTYNSLWKCGAVFASASVKRSPRKKGPEGEWLVVVLVVLVVLAVLFCQEWHSMDSMQLKARFVTSTTDSKRSQSAALRMARMQGSTSRCTA